MPHLWDFETLVCSLQVLITARILPHESLLPIFKHAVFLMRAYISTKINEEVEDPRKLQKFLDPIEYLTAYGNHSSLMVWKAFYDRLDQLDVIFGVGIGYYSCKQEEDKILKNYLEELFTMLKSLGGMIGEQIGETDCIQHPEDYYPGMWNFSSSDSSDSDEEEPKLKISKVEKTPRKKTPKDYMYHSAKYRTKTQLFPKINFVLTEPKLLLKENEEVVEEKVEKQNRLLAEHGGGAGVQLLMDDPSEDIPCSQIDDKKEKPCCEECLGCQYECTMCHL